MKRLGRFEFGMWRLGFTKHKFNGWFNFSIDKTACGCVIFNISRFYITYLSEYCNNYVYEDLDNEI